VNTLPWDVIHDQEGKRRLQSSFREKGKESGRALQNEKGSRKKD
jgi:hypothetical protein